MTQDILKDMRRVLVTEAVRTIALEAEADDRCEVLNFVFCIELEVKQVALWETVEQAVDDVLNQMDAHAETLNECFDVIGRNAIKIEKLKRALNAYYDAKSPVMPQHHDIGTNTGHGHVWERPDGVRARCGGPAICRQCARDRARVNG